MKLPSDLDEDYDQGLQVELVQEPVKNVYSAYCPYFDELISFRGQTYHNIFPINSRHQSANRYKFNPIRINTDKRTGAKRIIAEKKLSNEEKVLKYARFHGTITRNDVIELLEVSTSTASRVIRRNTDVHQGADCIFLFRKTVPGRFKTAVSR